MDVREETKPLFFRKLVPDFCVDGIDLYASVSQAGPWMSQVEIGAPRYAEHPQDAHRHFKALSLDASHCFSAEGAKRYTALRFDGSTQIQTAVWNSDDAFGRQQCARRNQA